MSDLKPCPFCGETRIEGPRAEHIERAAGYGYTVYNVGHSQLSAERTKCIAWATAESPEEAIERWNRRTQPEATAPAQGLSAAILAITANKRAADHLKMREFNGYLEGFAEARNKAAALASSANALSAGGGET